MRASSDRAFGSRHRLRDASGQSLLEMAMLLPFIVVLVLGVIELSYGLLDQHVVTKLSREGANLISRDATLDEAEKALEAMSTGPINFTSRSKMIFSVIKVVNAVGATNDGFPAFYQRFAKGTGGASRFACSCSSSDFGPGPNYIAGDTDNNANLRVTGVPAGTVSPGGFLYVTEIWTAHDLITPFDRFGISVPANLYSIAYF